MEKNTDHPNLVYKEIVKEDIDLISQFLNSVFKTKKFSVYYLNKVYFINDSVIGYNIFYNGNIIAHYCVIKRKYFFDSSRINVGWSVNTAVAREFRGNDFFKNLAVKTYDLCKKNNIHAIVGVANRNSTRLFLTKLNFIDKGCIRWNLDFFNVYQNRIVFPQDFHQTNTRIINFLGSKYLFKLPFIKVYSNRNYSFFSLYLTNRKSNFRIGFRLPQNWFKSNWQVIALNLFEENELIIKFIENFNIDILESDTF